MYIHVLVRMYIHVLVRMYIHVLVRMYIRVLVRMYIHVLVRMYIHVLVRMYIHVLVRMYIHVLVRMYIRVLVRMYIHKYLLSILILNRIYNPIYSCTHNNLCPQGQCMLCTCIIIIIKYYVPLIPMAMCLALNTSLIPLTLVK